MRNISKYLSGRKWELYNMELDRTETDDLSAEHPDMVREMADQWEKWAWRTQVLPKPE